MIQLYIHTHTFFFIFFSIIVYHRILKTAPCTTFSFSTYLLIDTYVASMCACVSHSVVSDSLRPHGLQLTRLLCPWNSPGKNTGVGCHSLLQGIFLTQGSNSGLFHCGLSHQGSPGRFYVLVIVRGGSCWSFLPFSPSASNAKMFQQGP